MAAKTAIDIEIEEIRQKIAAVDVTEGVYAYEKMLLDAQLATARKKLTVIPYIRSIITKQGLSSMKKERTWVTKPLSERKRVK